MPTWATNTPAQNQLAVATSKANRTESFSSSRFSPEGTFKTSKKMKRKYSSVFGDLDSDENCCRKCGGEATRQYLWDEFKRRDYSVVNPKLRPRQNQDGCKDNDGPFLCHARVYVFADRYDIAGLRILALDKLHQALCSFKDAREQQMGELIELTRYSYSNDNTRDNEAEKDMDALRSMVVHFVVCVFGAIVKDESFLNLMEEGGHLARDLTGLLGKRVTANTS